MDAQVWVNKGDEYALCTLVEQEDSRVKAITSEGKEISVDREQIQEYSKNEVSMDDLSNLLHLNEGSILHHLEQRYSQDLIYTWSGLFLIAINPYKSLPIYSSDYISLCDSAHIPHIFTVCHTAFQDMLLGQAQSILVTGESGAGKTETTKKVIYYFTSVSQSHSNPNEKLGLEMRLLATNHILEAFGNAQTVRNDNSSRFGKLIKLQFLKSKLSGCRINTYLLEKSRVVTRNKKERNFHIFYMLTKFNKMNQTFRYLEGNKNISVDDTKEFAKLIECFEVMGITTQEVKSILDIIKSILYLGNLQLKGLRNDTCLVENPSLLDEIASLLSIDNKVLKLEILQPKITAGREKVTQNRTKTQALFTIDSLSKSLYEKLFTYLVERINDSLSPKNEANGWIGVLDIAGFEIFEMNSFEQLCINYTNEKLQMFFNHQLFVKQQELYDSENIDYVHIDYGLDIKPTIDLIESSNPPGILACLDEECILPNATDTTFTHKIQKLNRHHSKFKADKFGLGFTVVHYAGDVHYDTLDWIVKNSDPLSHTITTMLYNSENELIRNLYEPIRTLRIKRMKTGIFRTVAQKHKRNLHHLIEILEDTQPYFVRCILPNMDKKSQKMDQALIVNQLRCNGVMEGIRLCRQGFPNVLKYKELIQKFECLMVPEGKSGIEKAKNMIQFFEIEKDDVRFGRTRIFFRAGVLASIEDRKNIFIAYQVQLIQCKIRAILARKMFRKLLFKDHAINILQTQFKLLSQTMNNKWWFIFAQVMPLVRVMEDGQKKGQRNQMNKELQVVKDELGEKDLILTEKEKELNKSKHRERELEESLLDVTDELEKLEGENMELKSAVNQLNQQLNELKSDNQVSLRKVTDNSETEDLNSKVETLTQENHILHSEIEKLKSSYHSAIAKCEGLEQQLKMKVDQINEFEQKKIQREKVYARLDEENRILLEQVSTLEELSKKKGEKEGDLAMENEELKLKIKKVDTELTTLRQEHEGKKEALSSVEKGKLALLERTEMLEKRAKTQEKELQNWIMQHDTIQKEYQELISKNELIEKQLAKKSKQIEEFHNYKKLVDMNNAKVNELEECLVETVEERNQLFQNKSKLEMELEEWKMKANESLEKWAKAEDAANQFRQELEATGVKIKELEEGLNISEQKYDALNTHLKEIHEKYMDKEQEVEKIKKAKDELDENIKKAELALINKEKQMDNLNSELENQTQQLKSVHNERNQNLEVKIKELQNEKNFLIEKIEAFKMEQEKMEPYIQQLEKEKQTLLQELELTKQQLEQEKIFNEKTNQELERARLEKSKLEHAINSSQETLRTLENVANEHEELKMKLKTEVVDIKAYIAKLEERLESKEKQLVDAKMDLEATLQYAEELEKSNDEGTKKLEAAIIEKEEMKSELKESQARYNQLEIELQGLEDKQKEREKNMNESRTELLKKVQSLADKLDEEMREKDVLSKTKENIQNKLEEIAHRASTLQMEINRLNTENTSLNEEIQKLNNIQQNCELSNQELLKVTDDKHKELESVVAKMNMISDELQTERSLKESLANKNKEFSEKIKTLEMKEKELLQNIGKEQSNFKDLEKMLFAMSKEKEILENECAKRQEELGNLQLKHGQNIEKKIQELEEAFLSISSEKEMLAKQYEAREKELNSVQLSYKQDVENQVRELEEAREALEAALQLSQQEQQETINKCQEVEEENGHLKKEVEELLITLEEEISARRDAISIRKTSEKEVEKAMQHVKVEIRRRAELEQSLAKMKEKYEALIALYEKAESAKQIAEKQIRHFNEKTHVMKKEIEDNGKYMKKINAQLESAENEMKSVQKECEELRKRNHDLKEIKSRLIDALAGMEDFQEKSVTEKETVFEQMQSSYLKEMEKMQNAIKEEKELLKQWKIGNTTLTQQHSE